METVLLGDAGAPNDDASYTGEVSDSPVSVDYVRTKIREFQAVMNALHESYESGLWTWNETGQTDSTLDNLLRDYESNSAQIKALAETLNVGAEAANAVGLRMPVLSIPQTLGVAPMAIVFPAAVVAAIAAVASWVSYARGYSAAMTDAIRVVRTNLGDTEQARAIEQQLTRASEAQRKINLPDLSQISGTVKLISIAALAFLGWKVWSEIADHAAGGT